MTHRCGRTLDRTDGIAGMCQTCGDLLTTAEVYSAMTKGSTHASRP